MKNEWTRTVVHTEDISKSRITVMYYTNGTKKPDGTTRGSYTYDVHSEYFPHYDPIASSFGLSINECIKKAKQAHYSFWGPLGERRL